MAIVKRALFMTGSSYGADNSPSSDASPANTGINRVIGAGASSRAARYTHGMKTDGAVQNLRDAALAAVRAAEPELRARGISSLYLFGSTARGTATVESDVDLVFDDDPERPLGILALIALTERLSVLLGRRADLVPRDSLHRLIRDDVTATAVRVF